MSGKTFSIKIPFLKIVHFENGRRILDSRVACFKGFAHYDRRGRSVGKSIRNIVGDLIHYDSQGRCSGYSKRNGIGRITHFNNRGRSIGATRSVLGVFYIHHWAAENGLYLRRIICYNGVKGGDWSDTARKVR